MPIYTYECPKCAKRYEVVKTIAEIDSTEQCFCGEVAKRVMSRTNFTGASDWDKTTYCPALGQVVKSDAHRRRIARERGLEEVGNEDVSKVAAAYQRDMEKAKEKEYDKAANQAYNHLTNAS